MTTATQEYALVTVSQAGKNHSLVELVSALVNGGLKIIASEGTANYLLREGIDEAHISDVASVVRAATLRLITETMVETGLMAQAEEYQAQLAAALAAVRPGFGGPFLNHRVVTLTDIILAGLVCRDDDGHRAELEARGYPFFRVLVVEPYPLAKTAEAVTGSLAQVLDGTDIGGITAIWAAIKGGGRWILCHQKNWPRLTQSYLPGSGTTDSDFQEALALEAASMASHYYDPLLEQLLQVRATDPRFRSPK